MFGDCADDAGVLAAARQKRVEHLRTLLATWFERRIRSHSLFVALFRRGDSAPLRHRASRGWPRRKSGVPPS